MSEVYMPAVHGDPSPELCCARCGKTLGEHRSAVHRDVAGCPCTHPRYFEGKCIDCLKPEGSP